MFKRIITFFVCLTLICSAFSFTAYSKTKKCYVKFYVYNGEFKAEQNKGKTVLKFKYKKGERRGYAPSIKREGYSFNGWFTKKKGGKKYTAKTKINKNIKLFPHWLKEYKINTDYFGLIGKPYIKISDLEKIVGKLTVTKKWTSDDTAKYTSNSGDIYNIYRTIRYNNGSTYSSYYVYYVSSIKCKAKHLVNIKKKTKYTTFMKKMNVDWMYYSKIIKKHKFSFTYGTTEYIESEPSKGETMFILWSVKMKKNNKIKPNTFFTLSTVEGRLKD